MRNQLFLLAAVCLSALCPVYGFVLMQEGYTIQELVSYSAPSTSGRMEFDSNGNLYIGHRDEGKILKITMGGQVSTLASGIDGIYDMVWAGGTNYGDYLYVTAGNASNDRIWRISLTGNCTTFATMGYPYNGSAGINIDRNGLYGNQMYVGTSSYDCIASINPSGSVFTFSSWPGTNGGGVYGLAFDSTGKYNYKMYFSNIYNDPGLSGVFVMNPNGSVSKFCPTLASALSLDFDKMGTYFNKDLFVIGRLNFNDQLSLWRIGTDGTAQQFIKNIQSFAFGKDGAMYVSYYNWNTQVVSVARVVPEPATLLMLVSGAFLLRKRSR